MRQKIFAGGSKMEELVDLVDETGRPVAMRVLRSEVKRRKEEFLNEGLYQPIVVVVVLDAVGRVVAQVRGRSKGDDGAEEIDHVCGVITSGETWMEAANREAAEEVGVTLDDLRLVSQGVNVYNRYRILAAARAVGTPKVVDAHEVSRVFAARPEELHALRGCEVPFVRGFFADLELALVLERQKLAETSAP
jgi:8-oxo-dGTP pyrophosphatase MutT (NUDIX family)